MNRIFGVFSVMLVSSTALAGGDSYSGDDVVLLTLLMFVVPVFFAAVFLLGIMVDQVRAKLDPAYRARRDAAIQEENDRIEKLNSRFE